MFKTIIKETGIVVLLLLVVTLVLAIIFYDYIPSNKIVPVKIQAYDVPEDIKQELGNAITITEQNIIRTYYIDSTDLNLYEDTNEYDKGKPNPFAQDKEFVDDGNSIDDGNTVYIPGPGKID